MQKARRTLVVKNGSLLNQNLAAHYNAYCKIKKINKYQKPDKHLLRKIAGEIFKEVGIQIVKSKGGVFIRNFGYFFVWKTPVKSVYVSHKKIDGENEEIFNHHTKHYKYKPIFVPAGGPNNLRFWSMDNKFTRSVKDGINKQLRAGHVYTSYVYSIRRLLNLS